MDSGRCQLRDQGFNVQLWRCAFSDLEDDRWPRSAEWPLVDWYVVVIRTSAAYILPERSDCERGLQG